MMGSLHPRQVRALDALRGILARMTSERHDAQTTVTRTEIERLIEDVRFDGVTPCGMCGNAERHFIACGACGACVFCMPTSPCQTHARRTS